MSKNIDESEEYVAYIANFLDGTTRTERFILDEYGEFGLEQQAKEFCKNNEQVVKIEPCKTREYRASVEVTSTYTVSFTADSYADAMANLRTQLRTTGGGAHPTWDDCRPFEESRIVYLEEDS